MQGYEEEEQPAGCHQDDYLEQRGGQSGRIAA